MVRILTNRLSNVNNRIGGLTLLASRDIISSDLGGDYMTTFMMTVGLPRSGKTAWANQQEGFEVFSSDKLRKELFGDETDQSHNAEGFAALHKRVRETLKEGRNCILDATNVSRRRRISFLKTLDNISDLRKVCVLFIATPADCVAANGGKVPDEVIFKYLNSFETPGTFEGWDDIQIMMRSEPVALSSYDYHSFDQRSKHHSKTLGDHQDAAAAFCKEHWPQLITAAQYHDIGKPFTQKIDQNGEAHYYNHHNVGAYIYLCSGGDLYTAQLINCHMAPLIRWRKSEKLMQKDMKLFGNELYMDILRLSIADQEAR